MKSCCWPVKGLMNPLFHNISSLQFPWTWCRWKATPADLKFIVITATIKMAIKNSKYPFKFKKRAATIHNLQNYFPALPKPLVTSRSIWKWINKFRKLKILNFALPAESQFQWIILTSILMLYINWGSSINNTNREMRISNNSNNSTVIVMKSIIITWHTNQLKTKMTHC